MVYKYHSFLKGAKALCRNIHSKSEKMNKINLEHLVLLEGKPGIKPRSDSTRKPEKGFKEHTSTKKLIVTWLCLKKKIFRDKYTDSFQRLLRHQLILKISKESNIKMFYFSYNPSPK